MNLNLDLYALTLWTGIKGRRFQILQTVHLNIWIRISSLLNYFNWHNTGMRHVKCQIFCVAHLGWLFLLMKMFPRPLFEYSYTERIFMNGFSYNTYIRDCVELCNIFSMMKRDFFVFGLNSSAKNNENVI